MGEYMCKCSLSSRIGVDIGQNIFHFLVVFFQFFPFSSAKIDSCLSLIIFAQQNNYKWTQSNDFMDKKLDKNLFLYE